VQLAGRGSLQLALLRHRMPGGLPVTFHCFAQTLVVERFFALRRSVSLRCVVVFLCFCGLLSTLPRKNARIFRAARVTSSRSAVVQAALYGDDNWACVATLNDPPDRLRSIAGAKRPGGVCHCFRAARVIAPRLRVSLPLSGRAGRGRRSCSVNRVQVAFLCFLDAFLCF
jgi:hypothetical protein